MRMLFTVDVKDAAGEDACEDEGGRCFTESVRST